ncbi:MAG: hypothetical protein C4317_04345 [Acidimicrobiia bacterium]
MSKLFDDLRTKAPMVNSGLNNAGHKTPGSPIVDLQPHSVGVFESFDGTEIAYEVFGPRPRQTSLLPVVVCNGIACVAHAYWDSLVSSIAEKIRVVLWDYRGHGASSDPCNPSEITVPSFSRDLLCLMEELGMNTAIVVGHSFGVQVALEAIRINPGAAAGLVAVAGPHRRPLGDLYGFPLARVAVSVLEPLAEMAAIPARILWHGAFRTPLPFAIGKIARMVGPRATAEAMRNYFEGLGALDPILLLRMFKAMDYQDATDLLPTLNIPVLLVAGTADVMTPLYVMETMHRLIPDSEMVVLEGVGHTLPAEAPDELANLVAGFVEKLSSRYQ